MADLFDAHISEDGLRRQSVADHLTGTAERAARFAAAFDQEQLGRAAGLMHDIGKYSGDFQRRIHDPQHSGRVDHSTAGAKEAYARGLYPLAFAVAGHHAGLPDGGSPKVDTAQASTLFGRLKRELPAYDAWRQEIDLPAVELPGFCAQSSFSLMFFTRMLYSCLVDADYLDTEAFMENDPPPRGESDPIPALLHRMRSKATSWLNAPPSTPLNEKRNQVLRACMSAGAAWQRGAYTLTVPTGGGKTFDSLAFALEHAAHNHMDRIIYVIPYTSIIDQTAAVFSDLLGAENVLAHHAGADYQLLEEQEMSPADYRRALAAENWDAPVIVTTAVQFFQSLYASRSSRCRKLHNIANSVIIFDEAQTLPLAYLRPCIAAIAELVRHYRTTAVLCTATQPALDPFFEEFLPGSAPLQEICPNAAALYTALRRTTLHDLDELSAEALGARLCGHEQVLCVVNRREQAQELYAALPAEGRYCLTTLLCAADRRRQLAEIRQRLQAGLPCRVVSTSLIEAGVDVDFPAAYREATGLDSILQTAGRCNREGRRGAAESPVYVFAISGNPDPPMLAQNLAAWKHVRRTWPNALDLPPAIQGYFTKLRLVKGAAALDQKGILHACVEGAEGPLLPFSQIANEFTFIDTPTRTIHLPIGEGASLCRARQGGARSRALFRKLGIYSVAVYPKHFDALYHAGALTLLEDNSAILSNTSLYDPGTGLAMDVEAGEGFFL